MKKVIIKNFEHAEVADDKATFGFLKIPAQHDMIRAEGEMMEVSDGYHTFDELYEHRIMLFLVLCKNLHDLLQIENPDKYQVWRSRTHSDGSSYDGWFVMGIGRGKGQQITYHVPEKYWEQTIFAETLEKAPEFDGHSSADVLERLSKLL